YQNKEYLFYGYMRLYQLTGWGFKGFIALTALLQSLLVFVIVFQLWKNYGYSLVLVFFLFWVVTNLFHTQMNIIRASFSIYLFAISILYKFRGKLLLSFILMVAALGFHRSALISFCFLVIPDKMYFFACKHAFKIYV
ncbi:TPA: O21 family O-antigen polymerase, partial [Escherichia coli]|nr:O21 family O-antigen polymerase [Escherichia coli]